MANLCAFNRCIAQGHASYAKGNVRPLWRPSSHSKASFTGYASRERVIRRFKEDVAAETEQEAQSNVNTALKRAYLIYNPVAGQENPASILGDIALKLSDQYQLTVCQTKVITDSCQL